MQAALRGVQVKSDATRRGAANREVALVGGVRDGHRAVHVASPSDPGTAISPRGRRYNETPLSGSCPVITAGEGGRDTPSFTARYNDTRCPVTRPVITGPENGRDTPSFTGRY